MMTDRQARAGSTRPGVSVVVPFLGRAEGARQMIAGLGALRLEPDDEVIVADNTPDGVVRTLATRGRVRVVTADAERSSYHARNVGAEHASNEWLLFLDADSRPRATLLDDYFQASVAGSVGALAGEIAPAADQDGLLARWARSRGILSQRASMVSGEGPAAATANLLVRRAAWDSVGGFVEGVRSGADFDFCWRLRDAGWEIDFRPQAVVEHLSRETLSGVVRQMARYAAGNAWQNRRRPGSSPPPRVGRALARSAAGGAGFALTGRLERAALKGVDGIAATAQAAGRLLGNAAPREARPPDLAARSPFPGSLVIATDRFAVGSETFVVSELEALSRLGWRLRVEAVARPHRPVRLGAARAVAANFLEDEGVLERAAATAWLAGRHPLRALRDLADRRGWSPEERLPLRALAPMARRLARGRERHVHVHFAALAAVNALRAGRLIGVPVSVAPHGHELFVTPRALPRKLERAAFVAAPCEYTAGHVREMIGPQRRQRVHTIVMGVNGERFRRRRPRPAGRTVVSVGRLVEKKGFVHLIDAAALLQQRAPLERVVIAGDGPLREPLMRQARRRGAGATLEFPGALSSDAVRDLLEDADLFVMPCVVASDGDRDAMPVAVKEALAMEVPVVASDEAGLPEVVRPEWGRLAPPGSAAALAGAIEELLALSPAERAAMGAAGRAFVLESCDPRREAGKLAGLIAHHREAG